MVQVHAGVGAQHAPPIMGPKQVSTHSASRKENTNMVRTVYALWCEASLWGSIPRRQREAMLWRPAMCVACCRRKKHACKELLPPQSQ